MENLERLLEVKEKKPDFRVAFLGTGSEETEKDKKAMEIAERLAAFSTREGQKVVTGGYNTGVMEAASKGAYRVAKELGEQEMYPEGITVGDAFGMASEYAIIEEKKNLPERLQALIVEPDAILVFHGKTGSLIEILAAIGQGALEKFSNDKNTVSRPVIIIDSSLEHIDTLSQVDRKDEKFKRIIDDIYVVSAIQRNNAEIEKEVSHILDIYRQKKEGKTPSESEKEELNKYSLEKFLEDSKHFSQGGGI